MTGDLPISGDWNNTGIAVISVFRPSTHMFYLDYNRDSVWDGAAINRQYNFGTTGNVPVTGNWNTASRIEIGVFRNLTHLFYPDYNGNGVGNRASIDWQYNFGTSGDTPVSGKW